MLKRGVVRRILDAHWGIPSGLSKSQNRFREGAPGAAYLAKGALVAAESLKQDGRDGFLHDVIATARFFAENLAAQSFGLARIVMNGAGSLKAGGVSEFAC